MQQSYHAVFVATGAQKSVPLGVPGEDLAGIVSGTSFLRGWRSFVLDT
jgi:NADPH-dependent glutamate synthase beta subunit-like oxidoreductase